MYRVIIGYAILWALLTSSTLGETRRVSTLRGGSMTVLINSIKEKLLALPDQTVVYPGHGPITSIGKEKALNQFLIEM